MSILDEHTRECLGGLVERSITADTLIDQLDVIAASRGYPTVLAQIARDLVAVMQRDVRTYRLLRSGE